MRSRTLLTLALFATIGIAACSDGPTEPGEDATTPALVPSLAVSDGASGSYLLIGQGRRLPSDLQARVVEAGGRIEYAVPEVGVAVATADDPSFLSAIQAVSGLEAALPNVSIPLIGPTAVEAAPTLSSFGNPPASGDDDLFFDLQWGMDAIDAPEAWTKGARGAGVRIAIIDAGVDASHPDLAPNVDFASSTSFIPGEAFDQMPPAPAFNHGTHVAGIAAAADNGVGVIGVAPEAEIIGIKVFSAITGAGNLGAVIAALVHAGNVDADVANMSLGATLSRRGEVFDAAGNLLGTVPAAAIQSLVNAMKAAAQFAHEAGVTLIASAGNAGTDGDKDKDRIHIPSDLPHVLSISATSPRGWGLDQGTDLDVPASYTNFGQSVIDFAAPGGDVDPTVPGNCLVAIFVAPCLAFDLVISASPGTWIFAAGTSMAAPHVSGVAALIIGQNGGSMRPAHVVRELRRAADDLGKRGNDDFFGLGRVNASNAVH